MLPCHLITVTKYRIHENMIDASGNSDKYGLPVVFT